MKHRGNIIASIRQCKGKGDQQECVQVVLLTVPCVSVTDGCQTVGSVCVCECVCASDLSLKSSSDCMSLLTGHTVNYSTTPSR